jgi:hypothetical protein
MAGPQTHVFGLSRIYVQNANFNSGTLSLLGICTNEGSNIEYLLHTEDFQSDASGLAPHDVQYMGSEARWSYDLLVYDNAVINAFISGVGIVTAGTLGPVGGLYIGQGFSWRHLFLNDAAGTSESPLNFPVAFLDDVQSFNVGTKKTVYKLKWRAIAPITGTNSSSGSVLYNNVST